MPSNLWESTSFWVAWMGPLALLLLPWIAANVIWGNPKARLTINLERANAPFVASISVMGIAVPLAATLLVIIARSSSDPWTIGILLGTVTFAAIALVTGGYSIFKISLQYSGDLLVISGGSNSTTKWIPSVASITLFSVGLFLLTGIAGLVGFLFSVPDAQNNRRNVDDRYAVMKNIPEIGSTNEFVLDSWGTATHQASNLLIYKLGDSDLAFCFEGDSLAKIIEYRMEEFDALIEPCG